MKLRLIAAIGILSLIFSCNSDKNPDPFKIHKQNVGLLTDSTEVRELKTIFEGDSIYRFEESEGFSSNINTIEVFEKNGNPLLALTPATAKDSTSTITSVRFIDPRYITEKGISNISTFKDIKDAYDIKSISNLINTVLVSVKKSNITFTIDKKELPASARFVDMEIDPIQIPDDAKIKYFFLHWD